MIKHLLKGNASKFFLLIPVMGGKIDWGEMEENNFINSYLKDKNREDIEEDVLFVLFKPPDFDNFELFLQKQQENPDFIEDYDYEGGYVVLVYRINNALKADFNKFKQGKYSEFSDITKRMFKRMIPEEGVIFGEKLVMSFQWKVFNKSPVLKRELEELFEIPLDANAEIWSIPNEEKETLNIDLIKEIHNSEEYEQQSAKKSNRKARPNYRR